MRSELEIPSLGRKGLRGMVCVVWCVERGKGKGEERRREGKHLSLSINSPSTPLRDPLRGQPPVGPPVGPPAGPPAGHHTLSNTLHSIPYPANTGPKMGDPHLLPTRGKGGKRGGKGHFLIILSPIFLSGGEPPDPPLLLGRAREKTRKTRARVMLTGRTKSIDLDETSSTTLSVSS